MNARDDARARDAARGRDVARGGSGTVERVRHVTEGARKREEREGDASGRRRGRTRGDRSRRARSFGRRVSRAVVDDDDGEGERVAGTRVLIRDDDGESGGDDRDDDGERGRRERERVF